MYELDALLLAPAIPDLLACVRKIVIRPGTAGSWMSADRDTREVVEATLREHWPEVGEISYLTVVYLNPGAQIPGHCDAPIPGTRYHIPLQQNDDCWSYHDGTWQRLQVGRVYTMDPARPHGSINWGTTDRLHLVVDTP